MGLPLGRCSGHTPLPAWPRASVSGRAAPPFGKRWGTASPVRTNRVAPDTVQNTMGGAYARTSGVGACAGARALPLRLLAVYRRSPRSRREWARRRAPYCYQPQPARVVPRTSRAELPAVCGSRLLAAASAKWRRASWRRRSDAGDQTLQKSSHRVVANFTGTGVGSWQLHMAVDKACVTNFHVTFHGPMA